MPILRACAVESMKAVDVALFSCGYESRCVYAAEKLQCRTGIALSFRDNQNATFALNARRFSELRIPIVSIGEERSAVMDYLKNADGNGARSVLIDITSMNRRRMAASIEAIEKILPDRKLSCYFSYCFSDYIAPLSEECYSSLDEHGPVSRYFSGLTNDVDQPLAMILGLGYEAGRAIGITEANDPSMLHLFVPTGGSGDFDRDVVACNSDLLSMSRSARRRTYGYDVNDFNLLYEKLESLVYGLIQSNHRVVVVPMGPKPFCLAALSIASVHREVSVWRASGLARENPVDRRASGKILVFESIVSHPNLPER